MAVDPSVPRPRPIELLTSIPGDGPATRSSYDGWLDLINQAQRRLILASYSFGHFETADQPEHPVFGALADAMHRRPALAVDLILSMETLRSRDERPTGFDLERRLARKFEEIWTSGVRLPRLLGYAPEWNRDAAGRASAINHAKFAVCDDTRVLVTSANLTRTAYEDNLEIGVVIEDGALARRLAALIDSWLEAGLLRPVGGP